MAGAVGVDLDHGHADLLHALGVDRSGDVALDHGRLQAALEVCEQGFQERGLARAGRTHHVDAEDAGGVEPGTILGGELVVGFEDFLGGDDFHGMTSAP